MLRPIDNYFLQKQEPVKSCMLYLRDYIAKFDAGITEDWKYGMPFFCFKGKMLCYLWTDKKTGQPYIGFVDGKLLDFPQLKQEKRARMKTFAINPEADIPVGEIAEVLAAALVLRK
ncbi:DUF1801 domain-containing protein [Flavobacterium alkalisoli]|uniref:DUF1801 domain-containing protein n=1 Tax=Flavobacterium alkalisoli TaxID=2602769 RepID=UPI003A91A125